MLLTSFLGQGRRILLCAAVMLGASAHLPVWAQVADDTPTIEELARAVGELREALQARDATIAAMQQRLVEMERRSSAAVTADTAPEGAPELAQAADPPAPEGRPMPPDGQPPAAAVADAPEQAPGQITVDEATVATALERALVQEGGVLLPTGTVQLEPSFSYVRRERTVPLVADEFGQIEFRETHQDTLSAGLAARVGLPFDSQLTLSVPYRFQKMEVTNRIGSGIVEERNTSSSGLGDFAITASKGLLREGNWRPNLIASVSWDTATGGDDGGVQLGSGFHEITGTLTATKSQDPLVFVGSLSFSHSFEDRGFQPGNVVGLSIGTVLAASPETSLRFFLDQNFIGDAAFEGQDIASSDNNATILSVGASSILTSRLFLDVEAGIGLTEAAPEYVFSVSLPIRF